jgi:hypothetical protein
MTDTMSENTTSRSEPPEQLTEKAGKPAGKRHEVEAIAGIDIKPGPRRALVGAGL